LQLLDFLSSIRPIPDYNTLKRLFAHRWAWWESYAREIAEVLCPLDIPYTPVPPKRRQQKGKAAEIDPLEPTSSAASVLPSTRFRRLLWRLLPLRLRRYLFQQETVLCFTPVRWHREEVTGSKVR
jgi:hypothetical protein